jgi:hypothetical protein
MLLEHLRKRFGDSWYADREAGPYLIKRLCAQGSSTTAGSIAKSFTSEKGLDEAAPARVLKEAWSWLHSGDASGAAEKSGAAESGGATSGAAAPR